MVRDLGQSSLITFLSGQLSLFTNENTSRSRGITINVADGRDERLPYPVGLTRGTKSSPMSRVDRPKGVVVAQFTKTLENSPESQ